MVTHELVTACARFQEDVSQGSKVMSARQVPLPLPRVPALSDQEAPQQSAAQIDERHQNEHGRHEGEQLLLSYCS